MERAVDLTTDPSAPPTWRTHTVLDPTPGYDVRIERSKPTLYVGTVQRKEPLADGSTVFSVNYQGTMQEAIHVTQGLYEKLRQRHG